jgi:hypothetical protein
LTYALLAEDPEKEEQPRLWSKVVNVRTPVDEVADEHTKEHGMLIRWGLWVRRSSTSTTLASVEGRYSRGGGTPPATAPLSADPLVVAVEFVVSGTCCGEADCLQTLRLSRGKRHLLCDVCRSRSLLIMFYAFRCSGWTICRALKLAFAAYPRETYRARDLVHQRLPYIMQQVGI